MAQAVHIFIAYARKDSALLDEFRVHLNPLERTGKLRFWYDGLIEPGAEWEADIKKNLHAADIILLLVSADAIASDYFYDTEVADALDRHRKGSAHVVPMIVRPCAWTTTPLAGLQALPKDGKPVTSWSNPDEAFTYAAEALWDMVNNILEQREDKATDARSRIVTMKKPEAPKGMVLVKGGTFDMGGTSEQQDCLDDEKPVTRVTVDDFYMGKYAVTFDEYDAFCAATGREKPSDEGWGRGQRPVINVSWNDAVAFCNWLSEQQNLSKVYTISGNKVTTDWTAKGYRLPTEAEWEYAARDGGKAVLFGNGKNVADPQEINFDGSAVYKKDYLVAGEYRGQTVPVGSLNSPNLLGLHDMSGNVWEWCWDWKAPYPGGSKNNYRGLASGSFRVLRGGSWFNYPQFVRVAYRGYNAPGYRGSGIGFRLSRCVK